MIKLNTIFPTEAYIPLLSSSASHRRYLTNTHKHFVRKRRIFNAKPVAILKESVLVKSLYCTRENGRDKDSQNKTIPTDNDYLNSI
jgi:hypothetical protein